LQLGLPNLASFDSLEASMPATGPSSRPHRAAGVCMSELLASCAAAAAVSRPPRAPDPEPVTPRADRRTTPDPAGRTPPPASSPPASRSAP